VGAGAAEEPPAPPLLQIEGVASMATGPPAPPLLQIENAGPPAAGWSQVGELPQLAGGGTLLRRVGSDELLFLRVDGDTYAYRPRCPGCGGSLAEGVLHGVEVACPGCRRRFDVRRAGRCLEAPQLHLEPVPLLVDGAGTVKVALA
jgi:nitrite reductase/ring-hydroxylating ferredoxin subunit